MNLFRQFVFLMNKGDAEEFYIHAARYEQFLKEHGLQEEYYKIKTNEGFFDVNHRNTLRALQTAAQLDSELRAAKDSDYYYLATGLNGDVHKLIRSSKADSIYRQALAEVGTRDEKFIMLTHMNLGQVNYLTNRPQSLKWTNLAIEEAKRLNNYEFYSLGLGLKCYLYFMMAEQEDFTKTERAYKALKVQFDSLSTTGQISSRQVFSHRYDKVIEVAHLAFEGKFKEAHEMANTNNLSVDHNLVIFRLYALEGTYEKAQAAKTLRWWLIILAILYVFVYIMGRRRLIRKIWKRNDELKVALEQADVANRMKASFIRSMSHEIRTPLNAINGFTQVLCNPEYELSEKEKADLKERITSNTEAITIIINELLELAADESVTLNLDDLTPVNINRVCSLAMAKEEEHNTKGLKLSFTSDLPSNFAIKSNEETILQILGKIISNALKFTEKGTVIIHAMKKDSMVEISITDTGIGIPAEKREVIFDNFVKLNDFKEGVGLGLTICRRLANTLGGNITIDPDYKTGSRFIVQLPVR